MLNKIVYKNNDGIIGESSLIKVRRDLVERGYPLPDDETFNGILDEILIEVDTLLRECGVFNENQEVFTIENWS